MRYRKELIIKTNKLFPEILRVLLHRMGYSGAGINRFGSSGHYPELVVSCRQGNAYRAGYGSQDRIEFYQQLSLILYYFEKVNKHIVISGCFGCRGSADNAALSAGGNRKSPHKQCGG